MSILFAFIARLLIIYIVVRLVWTMFAGRKNKISHGKKKPEARVSRFDTRGKNVDDADFEELK